MSGHTPGMAIDPDLVRALHLHSEDRAQAAHDAPVPHHLFQSSTIAALMDGRYAASVADVRRIAPSALRHRVLRTFEAEADGVEADDLVEGILAGVPVETDGVASGLSAAAAAGGAV